MAQAMLEDPEYRKSLKKRLISGKAPHMETLLHHYAFGKPKERFEHEFVDNAYANMSTAELLERLVQLRSAEADSASVH